MQRAWGDRRREGTCSRILQRVPHILGPSSQSVLRQINFPLEAEWKLSERKAYCGYLFKF